jgi:hypothetical protein
MAIGTHKKVHPPHRLSFAAAAAPGSIVRILSHAMKLLRALLLGLILTASAIAQTTPGAAPPPPGQPNDAGDPKSKRLMDATPEERTAYMQQVLAQADAKGKGSTPAETVQPALPASSLPDNSSPSFSQDEIRQIETALKKQMMLVGMGSGVVGLLLGMMIGRKTASRPTGRRY